MATRFGFVVKIERFLPQIGDEIRPRRQKTAFLSSNWRREYVSSSKIGRFLPQNGDENRPRRQKMKFPDQKR